MKTNRRTFLILSFLALGAGFATRAFAVQKKLKIKFDDIVSPKSTISCPVCKTKETLVIPGEVPLRRYLCPVCLTWLAPKKGDHCIFDSYGSQHCQEIQIKIRRQNKQPIPADSDIEGNLNV
jgi:hypothetical protein